MSNDHIPEKISELMIKDMNDLTASLIIARELEEDV
jgi:hypothetical protein